MSEGPARPVGKQAACIAVVGPTASGKSDLAIRLAAKWEGEIVNFDSVQVYRGFDIGTAKTPPGERHGIPHHLLDHVEPGQDYSAGQFARDARAVLEHLRCKGKLPVLAGGTGFYLEALLKGLFEGPREDPSLRERLRERAATRPAGYVWRILERLDPEAAARIHRNDTAKVIRAIEVSLLGGRPISEQFRGSGEPLRGFDVLCLGLQPPRPELYERIGRRTRRMFAQGLVDEAGGLLRSGVSSAARPFRSLGYAQCLQCLDGACSLEEAIESTIRETRRYAKRQLTWFRNRTAPASWWHGFGDTPEAFAWAEARFRDWRGGEA